MGGYIPASRQEQERMLKAVGAASMDALFAAVPESIRLRQLNLPPGRSELEVSRAMRALAGQNTVFPHLFRGAGAYRHYIPSIVRQIAAKEEFVTAYTPYQAEISQGILQAMFEYQTMICELTGMDVSNASVYDGASAAAEAAAMCRDRKRSRTLIAASAHPMTVETVRTWCEGAGEPLEIVPVSDGRVDADRLSGMLDGRTASFYLQQPNFYGLIEEAEAIGRVVQEAGAKFIMGVNPVAAALLKTPAECGADIATGEGQPLGLPLAFGGPYLGFMACRQALMRKLPGRIVGRTRDADGRRAFVLTLQAREQHIRREKASSNICSNQAHCALTAAIYLSVMGPAGFKKAASHCLSGAHYAAAKLTEIPGVDLVYSGEFFHEFVTTLPCPADALLERLAQQGILGGLPLEEGMLWCVTEMNSRQEIDRLADLVKEVCSNV